MKLGTNSVVFLLFFGLALVEAIKSQDYLQSFLYIALGIIFLRADFSSKK